MLHQQPKNLPGSVIIDGVTFVPLLQAADTAAAAARPTAILTKADLSCPAFYAKAGELVAWSGTKITVSSPDGSESTVYLDGSEFFPHTEFVAGHDYDLTISTVGTALILDAKTARGRADVVSVAGFHFAPGGNAEAREGGDSTPVINPHSIWDLSFRPECPDPRGMTLVTGDHVRPFWCDIYLTAAEHLAGTSRYGEDIADGNCCPESLDGEGDFDDFNFNTAKAVLAHHGKQLLSHAEFWAATFGVTEKTARGKDPVTAGLDAPRTSRFGVMQATGNLWIWGHDGDPDEALRRACLFGGSWVHDVNAGSRQANVGYWPEYSSVNYGARGRSDHLQLG